MMLRTYSITRTQFRVEAEYNGKRLILLQCIKHETLKTILELEGQK